MCRLTRYLAILCIAVLLVVTLCGCGAGSGDGIRMRLEYDTLEEMQADFPDYYYFSFNEQMISYYFDFDTKIIPQFFYMHSTDKINKNKSLFEYNYYGYYHAYLADNAFTLCIANNKRDGGKQSRIEYFETLPQREYYAGKVIIDNVDCYLSDYGEKMTDHYLEVFFELDNVIYAIYLFQYINSSVRLISLEEFVAFVTPMIENRYKGSSSPLVNIMCDNVEEVQTYLPDFSYFDFDYAKMSTANIKSKEQTDPNKETIEYDFYSYSINFKEYPVGIEPNIRNANITVYANKEKTIEELFPNIKDDYTDYLYSEHTVDGIQCIMTYSSLDSDNNYTIKLIFELDNVTYYIQLDETLEDIGAERLTEQDFLAFIEPIIKNR